VLDVTLTIIYLYMQLTHDLFFDKPSPAMIKLKFTFF